jgi:type VI protein secretion system component Hcp
MEIHQILPKLEITTPSGKVTLWNARIVGIGLVPQQHGSSSKHGGNAGTHELERVSFTFRKIDIENTGGGTAATDDWSAYPP